MLYQFDRDAMILHDLTNPQIQVKLPTDIGLMMLVTFCIDSLTVKIVALLFCEANERL